MILERFPELQALSDQEKRQLAYELLNEFDFSNPSRNDALEGLLNERWEEYLKDLPRYQPGRKSVSD